MTYCLGMKLQAGMVFASDSRTNAGVDNVGRFEKMRVFAREGERVVVTLSAGNLSVTQNALGLLEYQSRRDPSRSSFWNATSMYEVATMLGEAMREVQRRDGDYMRQNNIDASASFILGGQVRGEEQRLFMLYSEGNYIESSNGTNYFQIGEIKYGKPIIDRVTRRSMSLSEAAKCALISMDSTIRSNLSVGLPLDLVIVRRDELRVASHVDIDGDNRYFQMIRNGWGEALREAFSELPNPDWLLTR